MFAPTIDPGTGTAYTYEEHGFVATQAEGVANLHRVPATGCLISIGFPRFKGGVGGYASYTAICPPSAPHGRRISARDAPLPRIAKPLHSTRRPARGFAEPHRARLRPRPSLRPCGGAAACGR